MLKRITTTPTFTSLACRFFTVPYPVDFIVDVKGRYTPDAIIEIEAIAAVRGAGGPPDRPRLG